MTRKRHQPAWVATIRVSIPITTDAASLTAAQQAVLGLCVPTGATIEIINQNFGRMIHTPAVVAAVAGAATPAAASADAAPHPASALPILRDGLPPIPECLVRRGAP